MSQVIFWLCFRVNADVTSSSAMNSLQAVKQETLSIAQSCQMSAVKSTEDNRCVFSSSSACLDCIPTNFFLVKCVLSRHDQVSKIVRTTSEGF